jgi:hypothetical protein
MARLRSPPRACRPARRFPSDGKAKDHPSPTRGRRGAGRQWQRSRSLRSRACQLATADRRGSHRPQLVPRAARGGRWGLARAPADRGGRRAATCFGRRAADGEGTAALRSKSIPHPSGAEALAHAPRRFTSPDPRLRICGTVSARRFSYDRIF